jgi:hypothetical protein
MNASTSLSIGGGMSTVISGDGSHANLNLSSGSADLTLNGDLLLIGSGDNSLLQASLASTSGHLQITKDVNLYSLGEGSDVKLTLSQASGSAASVTGGIDLTSDSGSGSTIGSKASGDFTLGKLGTSSIDLFLNAVQDHDSASVSLKLFTDGGVAQLGSANQQGTASLTLGDQTAVANQLLDEIDISFTGTNGHAIINFGADQDATTAATIQRVMIKGFRLGVDELNFGDLLMVGTTGVTLDSFTGGAIGHFNTTTPSSTTSTPAPVADVLVGGNNNATYLAYDYDGTGVSAIIVLDGVAASAYKTANGLA